MAKSLFKRFPACHSEGEKNPVSTVTETFPGVVFLKYIVLDNRSKSEPIDW